MVFIGRSPGATKMNDSLFFDNAIIDFKRIKIFSHKALIKIGEYSMSITNICKVGICGDKAKYIGYCSRHYQQVYYHGKITNPHPSRRNIREFVISGEVAYIPLGSKQSKYSDTFAVIDANQVDKVKNLNWGYSSGYVRNPETKKYLHRVLAKPTHPMHVDHINGNPLDNRLSNLRICTQANNNRNSKKPINNKTGYKGVSLSPKTMKYLAHITYNKKHHFLGSFDKAKDAAKKYEQAAKRYFGEFASVDR